MLKRRNTGSFFYFYGFVFVLNSTQVQTADAYQPVLVGDSEITIRQAPDKLPAFERLAQAQRLYQAERFDAAAKLVRELAAENVTESAEAFYLLGKIAYARHRKDESLGYFEELLLLFPDSSPVTDGRLAQSIVSAFNWEVEDRNWRLAGNYLELLRQVDQDRMALQLYGLEQQLDRELWEFHEKLAGLSTFSSSAMRRWLADQDHDACRFVSKCFHSEEDCDQQVERKAEIKKTKLQNEEPQRWSKISGQAFQADRSKWAAKALETLQAYPLLRALASEQSVLEALKPHKLNVPSPFGYRIETGYGETYKKGWRKYAEGLQSYKKWKVCRFFKKSFSETQKFPELHFTGLSREALLARLRELLRGPDKRIPAQRRRL